MERRGRHHCWEVVSKKKQSNAQQVVNLAEVWSSQNHMQFNADKSNELLIDFKFNKHEFYLLSVNGSTLPVVQEAKILGLTIFRDLSWNADIY